jgi:hypothetical protein
MSHVSVVRANNGPQYISGRFTRRFSHRGMALSRAASMAAECGGTIPAKRRAAGFDATDPRQALYPLNV